MFRILTTIFVFAFMALGLLAPAASAYTLNEDGTGFVGKGEVQIAFGWNNKTLQANANAVDFIYESTEVSEVSWTCTNTNNQNTQERERTTTTTTSGVVDGIARDGKSQFTGFNLLGFVGDPTTSSTTEGNPLNSCPNGWILTPAGAPEVISSTGGIYAVYGGTSVLLPVIVP